MPYWQPTDMSSTGLSSIGVNLELIIRINIRDDDALAWIPEPSATGLRETDLNVLAKLGEQGLQRRLEAEAFARREVCGEDDLLDFLFGHSVDIQVTRQPDRRGVEEVC
jgi:hypothetical protein